jgi:hypothetical protein
MELVFAVAIVAMVAIIAILKGGESEFDWKRGRWKVGGRGKP